MKKTFLAIIILLVIALAISLFFNFRPHNCAENLGNDTTQTSTDAGLNKTGDTSEEDAEADTTGTSYSDDVHRYCYEFCDTAMAHVDWIDSEKFFNGYVQFLENAIIASDANELDIENYWDMMPVFSNISESMLCYNSELYDDVVYTSWVNLTYRAETTECLENAFASGYRDIVENEVKILKDFAKNPTVFPFENRW